MSGRINNNLPERHYSVMDLDEYIRQGEPSQVERSRAWQTAIGLQQVDSLKTSDYLLDTARQHIEGDITIEEAKALIDSYYKSQAARLDIEDDRTEEADKVAVRITELLSEKTFSMTPTQYYSIHRRLFDGIYKMAGRVRDYNFSKKEWVLRGESVYYESFENITATLEYEIRQEKEFSYAGISLDAAIKHLVHFCSYLWQIHPFCEGNTRTTAVFIIKYLRTLGFNVDNDLFAEHSWFFRNALVRANYSNLQEGIAETPEYLERFFRNMLLGEQSPLRNRELHLDWKPESVPQSVIEDIQSADLLSPKCKNCTLGELAVLKVIQQNPSVTQKQIAAEIGKSERTVKSLTVALVDKGIIERVNGKRNGHWVFVGQ